ncbi:MAG: tetratricopeptide repeat protein [Gammaproteobacteria bacterium]
MAEFPEQSPVSRIWSELQRRRVIRVIVLYAVAGWIVIEVASTVLPNLNLPEWTVTLVTALVVLGFIIAIMLAWAFDIGPGGVHRTAPLGDPVDAVTTAEQPAMSAVPQNPAKKPTTDDESRRAIAVLPFVNMSGNPENEYFSDGISEEILNLLVKLPQLRVASRTSSFALKAKDFDIPAVAERLNVSTVLEGSVRRVGDRVRITAQLIDTQTDSHLWSETYDRELKDVFAIQDDIAQSIVDALEVTLTPKERRAIQYVATSDAKAYDYYLHGRKFFYSMSKRNFHHAVRLYNQAIEQDPNYALAYAGIADAYSFLFMYGESIPENAAKSDEASRRAVELDPDSAEAHASRGISNSINRRYDDAEREFETAIMFNPALFEAHYFYARDCLAQGKFEKAARLFAEASNVNPADYQSPVFLSQVYFELGRNEERMETALSATKVVEKHLELHPDDTRALCLGAHAQATVGNNQTARDWADRALDADSNEPAVAYNVASTYAMLDDGDRALELLEQAVRMGFGYKTWMVNDNSFAKLRDEPRFKALLEQLD